MLDSPDFEAQHSIRTGPFNCIRVVPGDGDLLRTDVRPSAKTILRGLARGKTPNLTPYFDHARLGEKVVTDGQVTEGDLGQIQKHLSGRNSEERGVVLFASLVHFSDPARGPRGGEPRSGRVLTDFLTLLPVETAARIINVVTDPGVVRQVQKGEIRSAIVHAIRGRNIASSAIDILALFGADRRLEVFKEMARQSPGPNGRAFGCYRLLTNNWHTRSELSGKVSIQSYRPDDAEARILEVQGQFPEIKDAIISQGGGWPET